MEGQASSFKVHRNPTQSGPSKRSSGNSNSLKGKHPRKRARTKEDFLNFCMFVLEYADYHPDETEEELTEDQYTKESDYNMNLSSPVHDSLGSSSDTNSTELQTFEKPSNHPSSSPSGSSEDAITCFCNKPFGGRPMIECGSCETWIHLSCAKIRRNHIPEVFICSKCRDASQTSRKSTRVRTENKKFSTDL